MQQEHLAKFSDHCIKDTKGSELVVGLLPAELPENEYLVNATGLNDVEDTQLSEVFTRILDNAKGREVRVGVIGVWTDAKVRFLSSLHLHPCCYLVDKLLPIYSI